MTSKAPMALKPKGMSRNGFILLMLAPATVLLLTVTLFPFITALVMSFSNYYLSKPDDFAFIGFEKYSDLIASSEFWKAFRITAVFTFFAVIIQTLIGTSVALALHYEARRTAWLRLIYLLPMAITPVAATFTFRMMYNPSLGVFNHFMKQMGLPPQDWLGAPDTALVSLLVVDTWQWAPFIMLIAAGGLAAMDEEPLEAARMDGAGFWQILFHHVMPMLFPYLAFALLFRAIDAFKTFDIIFVLTGGGPGTLTRTLNLLTYKHGIDFLSMGYASALAVVMLIITIIASQVFLRRLNLLQSSEAR
jgi:multiple sugar transport system permease protein